MQPETPSLISYGVGMLVCIIEEIFVLLFASEYQTSYGEFKCDCLPV